MLGFVEFRTLSGTPEIVDGPSRRSTATARGNTFDDPRENLSANLHGTSFATIIVGMDMGSPSAASMPQPRQVGPDAPPPAPEGVGLFYVEALRSLSPFRRPPTSLSGPWRSSSRATPQRPIFLPRARLSVSRRELRSRSRGERQRPDAGEAPRRSGCRKGDSCATLVGGFASFSGTWLIQKPAQAYRCSKTRSDERLRTVDAVGDKHRPQAHRKCDAPNHLDLARARANSATHVVGALSAARARGRLRSPIHRAPASQQMLTQRSAAMTMAVSDKTRGVTDRRGRSQRAPRNPSWALIRRRLGTRQCVIRTHLCH